MTRRQKDLTLVICLLLGLAILVAAAIQMIPSENLRAQSTVQAQTSSSNDTRGVVYAILLIGFYFLPAINAGLRHHQNASAIGLTNLLLGWTVIGWIVALIWSSTANVQQKKAA